MSDIDFKAQIQQNWDIAQNALTSRTVILKALITDGTANRLIGHLLLLERLSSDPITLIIQSEGGQVYAGLALYDMLRHITVPLITIVDTISAGNALLLLLAGQKRYALANSHIVYTPIRVNTSPDIIQSRETQRLKAIYERVYQPYIPIVKETNPLRRFFAAKTPSWDLNIERLISPQEALQYKLIDAVVERVEDIPRP